MGNLIKKLSSSKAVTIRPGLTDAFIDQSYFPRPSEPRKNKNFPTPQSLVTGKLVISAQ